MPPERVELAQHRRALDQLAQRARLSEEGEAGKGAQAGAGPQPGPEHGDDGGKKDEGPIIDAEVVDEKK